MKLLILLLAAYPAWSVDINSIHYESPQAQRELEFERNDNNSKQVRSNDSWSFYYVDNCDEFPDKTNVQYTQMGLRYCKDRSASYVQPDSEGIGGNEGKCGHTMAANMFNVICKRAVHPAKYFRGVFRDITPGVRPGNVVSGLNKAFAVNELNCPSNQGNWRKAHFNSSSDFISTVKNELIPNYSHPNQQIIARGGQQYFRNPVGVLLLSPGSRIGLHWVMVIDHIQKDDACHFVINHWDSQYEVPCEKVAKWSEDAGYVVPIFIKSYQIVVFN